MMRHPEHHLPPNQMQRDPNRMGMHRMPAPAPRGMMVGPSPVTVQQTDSCLKILLLIFVTFSMLFASANANLSVDKIKELFDGNFCIEGVLVSLPATGPALITTAPIPQQTSIVKQASTMAMTEVQQQPAAAGVTQQQAASPAQPQQTDAQNPSQPQSPNNTANLPISLTNNKEKTPMCLINELARYNKIQHQYRLTSEQGPAHKKRFTVTLKLGNEEYEAEGPSIKKAQHSAAAEALSKTQSKHPPQKTNKILRPGNKHTNGSMLTPTVELNALAMKRGERTLYLLKTVPHNPYMTAGQPNNAYGFHRNNVYGPAGGQPRYNYSDGRGAARGSGRGGTNNHYINYDQRYGYNQYKPHSYPHQPPPPGAAPPVPPGAPSAAGTAAGGEMFSVILRVGNREYTGEGHTVQAARHNAASQALMELKQLPVPGETEGQCPAITLSVTSEHNGTSVDVNNELKSPISLVHEIALKRNLNVMFEVISEKGPPHMKVFITVCRVGDLVAEGEGNGKKISKKRAAEKMLEELSKLPPLPYMADLTPRLKRKRVVIKKKIRNLIKVNQDKSGTEYADDINPISRLIQIQQASKEKEPTYTVIEERGAPRHREFVIEASVNDMSCTGTGPNKKLAKRAAAEALLEILGYGKTTGQLAKPSIKIEKEMHEPEKTRKVKFMEEKTVETPVGGTSGRQLVPGLLLMGDQSQNYTQNQAKQNINMQQTAAMAKEFLKTGTSPTAEVIGGSKTQTNNQQQQGGTSQQGGNKSQQAQSGSTQAVRSKDQLLYLAQLLGVQVQFSDFPKANHEQYLTLVSLSTTPPQVCHGEGPTTEASHEKAALEALTVLSELGLDNVIPKKEQPQQSDGQASNKNNPMVKTGGMISNGLKK